MEEQKIAKINDECDEVANILKAIAHPQRLMLMCHLSEGEKNVSELLSLCEISQSQLSQFLNRMHRERLLALRKDGQYSYYSIADERVKKLMMSMQKVFCG